MSVGVFSGIPQTEWIATGDERDMRLLQAFSYTDSKGRLWPAPADTVIDGASIPRALWATVGSPYTDHYRRASIVHDVACRDPAVKRKDADKMFFEACLAGGCSRSQAKVLYIGVRIGAWGGQVFPQTRLARLKSHFPTTAKPNPEDTFLVDKFHDIAAEVGQLPTDADTDDIDKIIENHLSF